MSLIKSLTLEIIRRKKSIQILVALITIVFTIVLLGLRVNSSPYFLAQEHESRIHELDIKALFTNSGETILVVLKPSSSNPLDQPTVRAIKNLTKQFQSLTLASEVDSTVLSQLNKNEEEIIAMFNEIISEINKINLRMKIESLEDKISLNLDEKLYSELLSLRNQLKGG